MRMMERNKQKVYYSLFVSNTPVLDEDGNRTGETTSGYRDPVLMKVNISPATGYAQSATFGVLEPYQRVLVTDDMTCPLDENSVLYVDKDVAGLVYDYRVKQVAKSLNSISYLIEKVSKS